MSSVTPNLRLSLPTYDQPGWDTLINSNLVIIDSLLYRSTSLVGPYAGIYAANTAYFVNQVVTDPADSSLWQSNFNYTSSYPTFAQERAVFTGNWTNVTTSTTNAATSAAQAAGSATSAAASAASAATNANNAAFNAASASVSANTAASLATGFGDELRNKLINPTFTVLSMNALGSSVTANGYINDGWLNQIAGTGTLSSQFRATTDAERSLIADESTINALQTTVGSSFGTNDYAYIQQRIEGIRQYSGKYVTFSFWAYSSNAGSKIILELTQAMGTGGSPSANVVGIGQLQCTLTTTLTKYTLGPILVPSVIGKTLGTNINTDYMGMNIWLGCGATIGASRPGATITGGYTFNMFQPQLEVGSSATPFQRRHPMIESILCQRYYETGNFSLSAYNTSGSACTEVLAFKATKRITGPTMTRSEGGNSNATFSTVAALGADSAQLVYNASSTGPLTVFGTWIADARL